MQAMQAETNNVYKKYGVNPMGSCAQMAVQLPILFALYQVIYKLPAYVAQIRAAFFPLVDNLIGQNGSVKDKAKVLRIQSAAYAKGWESKAVKSSSSSKEEAEYVFDSEAAFLAYLADYQKVTDDLAEILEAAR